MSFLLVPLPVRSLLRFHLIVVDDHHNHFQLSVKRERTCLFMSQYTAKGRNDQSPCSLFIHLFLLMLCVVVVRSAVCWYNVFNFSLFLVSFCCTWENHCSCHSLHINNVTILLISICPLSIALDKKRVTRWYREYRKKIPWSATMNIGKIMVL